MVNSEGMYLAERHSLAAIMLPKSMSMPTIFPVSSIYCSGGAVGLVVMVSTPGVTSLMFSGGLQPVCASAAPGSSAAASRIPENTFPTRSIMVVPPFRSSPAYNIQATGSALFPTAHAGAIQPEQVEGAADALLHHVLERLRLGIERRHGRKHDRPVFRHRRHRPQVAQMQRRLAH